MPESRLTRADQNLPAGSIAAAVHRAAAWAAAAQGVQLEVPQLHPLASADQLAVVGAEFLDWVESPNGSAGALERWRHEVERLRSVV